MNNRVMSSFWILWRTLTEVAPGSFLKNCICSDCHTCMTGFNCHFASLWEFIGFSIWNVLHFMKYIFSEREIFCALIVFPTVKKKGRTLNHKMGHCKCAKGATSSEKRHFNFAIKQFEQAIWAFQIKLIKMI